MNHEADIKLIQSLVGRVCERTLACSSLKLRFGDMRPYIWIDPPWIFRNSQVVVTRSDEYPNDDEDFKLWSRFLDPINRVTFNEFSYSDDGALLFIFENGYVLEVPVSDEVEDEDNFYHHWYASA